MTEKFNQSQTTEQWAKSAGLDYRIKRAVVRFQGYDAEDPTVLNERTFDSQHVLFRNDNGKPLSVVGSDYKVVQPIQALDFFRTLVDGGRYAIENAGTFGGGARYWAQARMLVGDAEVVKGDKVQPYLFFSSSCDGSSSTVVDFTTVRIWCENSLRMALSRAKSSDTRVTVTHRTKVDEAVLADIRAKLGLADDAFTRWLQGARKLATVRLSDRDSERLAVDILSGPKDSPSEVRESRGFKSVMNLFHGAGKGADMSGVSGTAWGLLNAVTEHVDHHTKARTHEGAWFGDGANLKTRAFEQLLELA